MRSIKDELNLKQKKILLRLDLNVPLDNNRITDTTRIDKILPTIKYLLKNDAKIIILSHVGRPKGRIVNKLSLKPICENLKKKLNEDVKLITKKLKDLSDEQREVNNEFKKHKLGDWGLGLQKGLTQYVADFYDNELDMNEELARKNKQLDDLGYNDEIERCFASMDLDEQTRIQNEIDQEEFNIGHLPEDDDHGDNDDVQYGY